MFANKSLFIGIMIFIMAESFNFIHDLEYFIFASFGIIISFLSVIKLTFGSTPIESCSRILYFKTGLILFVIYAALSLTPYDFLVSFIALLSVFALTLSFFLEKGEIRSVNTEKDKLLTKRFLVIWVVNVILILLLSIASEALNIDNLVYIIYFLVFLALVIWTYPLGKFILNILRY